MIAKIQIVPRVTAHQKFSSWLEFELAFTPKQSLDKAKVFEEEIYFEEEIEWIIMLLLCCV